MDPNESGLIKQIEMRICKLQKSHVLLQEQFRDYKNTVERNIHDSALKIIDILDMIETTTSILNEKLIMKKIEKRLIELLKSWHVQEIIFKDGKIEAGKVRVIETRPSSVETPTGTIIEVCRKGYQLENKIIRPADVIAGCDYPL